VIVDENSFTILEPLEQNSTYEWRVRGVEDGEESEWSEVKSFKTNGEYKLTSTDEGESPIQTGLNQNYPNPFNPSTQIEFTLSDLQSVSLRVYDMAGRQVAVLVDGVKQAGRHTATFNASDLASGVYFYRFITDTQQFTRKMTLVK